MKLDLLRNKLVVCDTPCLLYLGRIGRLDLLRALFERVVVPSQVALELDMGRFWRADTSDPRKLEWVRLVEVSTAEIERLPANRLGEGERAVIAYALSHKDHLAGLDDRLARSFAEDLGLRVMGIVGMLIVAKREGLIGEMITNGGRWLLCDLLKFLTPAPSAGAIPVKPVRHRSRSGPARRPPAGLRAGTAGGYAAPQLNGFQT